MNANTNIHIIIPITDFLQLLDFIVFHEVKRVDSLSSLFANSINFFLEQGVIAINNIKGYISIFEITRLSIDIPMKVEKLVEIIPLTLSVP